ncbi:MAG: hypothetical protein HY822_03085 [Acidobacteria bacterium]|nr:hypothetical protein [Acidobacteriota bacterium]
MHPELDRRGFLAAAGALTVVPALAAPVPGEPNPVAGLLGKLRKQDAPAPLEGGAWYVAETEGDGLAFRFEPGFLTRAKYITADFLLDGNHLAVWVLRLQEGEKGRTFRLAFGGLNQCSFRVRMALALVDQNRWMVEREGAFLKPMCGGDRVDLDQVDRMTLLVSKKSAQPVRWCMTGLVAATGEPPRLGKPLLPKGPLADEMGQSTLHQWPGKTRSVAEMTRRIQGQLRDAPKQAWPAGFTRWGGWKAKKLTEGAGFFRTHHDGRRWWLADPDGYAFWSAGLDSVRVDGDANIGGIESALKWLPAPDGEFAEAFGGGRTRRPAGRSFSFLAANLIRALGKQGWKDKWAKMALAEMKRLRFNTVANWSEWQHASEAKFPYVRPMSFRGSRSATIYRDFPDVYHAGFEADAADYAAELKTSAGDPAFIGYFLMNEPTWGFSSELPAAGMLYVTETCATRDELARFLRQKYDGDAALASAWKRPATFGGIARGRWSGVLPPEALADLREFSVLMVERYFRTISKACKQADPNHLNLGMRWAGVPPEWAVRGMKFFDVFSLNCYQEKLPLAQAEKIHKMLNMPVMVGEWHFGALDAGLPASGIGHVNNQADRAKAYRVYLEDAVADPFCVGAHWFILYDQSALGRFDGENYNIGFLDVCHRAYPELGAGAIASHERMYQVADGKAAPFAEVPAYLPKLFL